MLLSTEYCRIIMDPFQDDPWGVGMVLGPMITASTPNPVPFDQETSEWTAEEHAGRILYLAQTGWDDPIQLDVGCPVLGYYDQKLIDGHHRLAAALYRGDKWIQVDVQGQLDVISAEYILEDTLETR